MIQTQQDGRRLGRFFLEGPRFPAFVGFATFFDTGRLTRFLRGGRALCAAGFFAELFFFVGFAIALKRL